MNNHKILQKLHACSEAVKWASQFPTLQEAWKSCPRGDWMLWVASKLKIDQRALFLARGQCANTVRHLMKDARNIAAVDATIAFGKGEIPEIPKDVIAAAYAAAADDASAYASAYASAAAYAAAVAADDASAYAYASAAADAAAYAAAYAASAYASAYASAAAYAAAVAADDAADADAAYAAAYAARSENRQKTANICREILTDEVFSKLKKLEDSDE